MSDLRKINLLRIIIIALLILSCAKREAVRPEKKEARRETPPSVKAEVRLDYSKILKLKAVRRRDLAALLAEKLGDLSAPRMKPRFYNPAQGITDIEDSNRRAYIERAVESGLMDVFPDGSFQPEDVIQRAHFAIIVQNILTAFGRGSFLRLKTSPYKDVPPTHYAYNAILLASEKGVLRPQSTGFFAPFEPLTGEEAVEGIDRLRTLLR